MKKLIALGLAGVMMLSSAGFAGSLTDPPPSPPPLEHIQPLQHIQSPQNIQPQPSKPPQPKS